MTATLIVNEHTPYTPSLTSRRLRRREVAGNYLTIIGRNMQWICEESGATYNYPVTEPVNKPVFCTSCGKLHLLKPGEWSQGDKEMVAQLSVAVEEDEDMGYMIDLITEKYQGRSTDAVYSPRGPSSNLG